MSSHEDALLVTAPVAAAERPPGQEWTTVEFVEDGQDPGGHSTGPVVRSAPLTWGQRALRIGVERYPGNRILINMRRVVPVPRRASAEVDTVLRAIGTLVGRHSSLRTRLPVVDGEWSQAVFAAGRLPVLLVRADPGLDAAPDTAPGANDDPGPDSGRVGRGVGAGADRDEGAATARVIGEQLAATAFDFAEEWPLRVACVLVGRRVRQIVVVFSHTTVDFGAVEVVLRDLRLLLLRTTLAVPAGAQSIDVAEREGAARYRQRSERCVARWSAGFGRLGPDTLPWREPPLQPRFRRALLVSEAADTAVRLVAERHRVTSSTVLLAATTAILARRSGNDVVGVYTMVNNRSVDGYRDAVANLAQLGLVVVDLTDRSSFASLLTVVWRAALDAYRHAYYDPADLRRDFGSTGYPSVPGTSPHCYFNDVRLAVDSDLFGRATAEAEVRAAMAASRFSWLEHLDDFPWRTRVEVVDQPGALGLLLTADSAHLPPAEAERFLRDLERLLVDAAFADVPWR
ncbi:condensation domain-containing protein [Micromonospora sp. NPDC050397]|uniref:condensation domain-containing protein n=1 Tax=Micromonospora sp. NPDC050397 TaxID=3364279 RepID=UPI00384C9250